MWASLLPGVRDLRAPLAAGYVWLLFGWLLFEPRQGSLGFIAPVLRAISPLDNLVSAAALAVAASFSAYLIGSLSSTFTDAVQRGLARIRPWRVQFGPERAGVVIEGVGFSYQTIWFQIHGDHRVWSSASLDLAAALAGPFGVGLPAAAGDTRSEELVEGRIRVPWGAVPFAFVVKGWANDLQTAGVTYASLREAVSTELRGGPASKSRYQKVGPFGPSDFGEQVAKELEVLLGEPVIGFIGVSPIDLLLGAHAYSERELIADGLLDEKSDVYGAVDRLRGEIELRDAMLLPLLALVILVSVTVSPVLLVGMGLIVGLALQRRALDRSRTDRLLAAVTWRPQRAPSLARIERVVRAAMPREKRSGTVATGPDQTSGTPPSESEQVAPSN